MDSAMNFIEITKNELIGINSIDEQHQSMAVLVNKLYDKIISADKKMIKNYLYKQILTSTDRYSKGLEAIGTEQLKGIRQWFFNHIELSDKKCGKYFIENG